MNNWNSDKHSKKVKLGLERLKKEGAQLGRPLSNKIKKQDEVFELLNKVEYIREHSKKN
jgi:hypothetical protein